MRDEDENVDEGGGGGAEAGEEEAATMAAAAAGGQEEEEEGEEVVGDCEMAEAAGDVTGPGPGKCNDLFR